MSLVGRLVRPQAALLTSHQLQQLMESGAETSSGAHVTPDSAMRVAAVYRAVRLLAEGVAQLPLHVYRRTDRGRERATDHWAYQLLHTWPNPWQTAFEFKEMQQAHLALRGNAYALPTVVRGEIKELLPIPPWRVQVKQDGLWGTSYAVEMPDGSRLEVPHGRMFHVPGLSFNGREGLSPISYLRETIGVAQQMTKHGGRLYANGARLSGVLSHPQTLSEEAGKRLRNQFDEMYAGVSNWYKTALLEEGMTWESVGMTAQDAQFVETMRFQRNEIAMAFGIPPHKLADLERATHSNIEQQAIEWVQDTLGPWLMRWEQRLNRLCFGRETRTYAEFLVDAALRGDFRTRMQGYRIAVMTGWMSRNEVRERENLNREEGLDEFWQPLNMGGSDDERSGERTEDMA